MPNASDQLWRQTRRLVVAVIGGTLILLGIALLVLPGPGTVVILLGLAVLAVEFAWARRLLKKAKVKIKEWRAGKGSGSSGGGDNPDEVT